MSAALAAVAELARQEGWTCDISAEYGGALEVVVWNGGDNVGCWVHVYVASVNPHSLTAEVRARRDVFTAAKVMADEAMAKIQRALVKP